MKDLSINAIRFLSVDQINKANSGHPGMPLGASPMMYTLFTKHMRITPSNSNWFNRDRFVLAAGHASSMLYATLHLGGYKITIDDLKGFRQLNSLTPGHPEYKHTDGIDATSGPLGQGIAMGVGFSLAETFLAAKFNKDDLNVIDHYTYVMCGDGDLQEGVTQEAMSFAGNAGLSKLVVLYDSNDIQLDGPVKNANTENVGAKYQAMNWNYILVKDGNDTLAIDAAITAAKAQSEKPTIIEVKTIIGFGSPVAGKSAAHGAPIGSDGTKLLRKELNWDLGEFEVPSDVYVDFKKNLIDRGNSELEAWNKIYKEYSSKYTKEVIDLNAVLNNDFAIDFDNVLKTYEVGYSDASRNTSGQIIEQLSKAVPTLIGGSADLTKSTKAKGVDGDYSKNNLVGRNINYGVREHAMAAIANGITLHGLKTFTGAFFVFSDYLKPSVRMAAIMRIPTTFVFSHDSIAVGEDGPTHQPVEQFTMFRATPNVNLLRPCDANETAFSWRFAMEATVTPTVICLSRQNLDVKAEINYSDFSKGAYVYSDGDNFDGILLATGSEVGLACSVQEELAKQGKKVRVVSMPCMDVFNKQSNEYKNAILPKGIKTLAIEMGASLGWYKYADACACIDTFGASANVNVVIPEYGYTVLDIIEKYNSL